jgi:transposase
MKQHQSNTKVAGIDVGKRRLDAAVHGLEDAMTAANGPAGFDALIDWFKARQVGRVGLEATGSYDRGVRLALEAAGFEVVVHQPIEVKLFAQLKRRRAKTDRLDAHLIAAATAQVDLVRAAQDARLVALGERMTVYEHVSDQIVQAKTLRESLHLEDMIDQVTEWITDLEQKKDALKARIIDEISMSPDLKSRFELLQSLPGVGPVVAAALVIRMPELGAMQHGQAASLLGVAPFDRKSGQWQGQSFISGGRSRPRRMLYMAALAAKTWDPTLKAFADRLLARGKPKKVIIVAVMRKLIEAANLVLKRAKPWTEQPA